MLAYDDLIHRAPAEYRDALGQEWKLYDDIQENAKIVLTEVGIETRNKAVINLLEATGLAGYDESAARIYLLPELVDQALDSAPKTFALDEGINILGIGGIPPFLYREADEFPMPASYEELEQLMQVISENLDVVRFLSQPVKVHRGDPLACNKIMDRLENCIKVTCSAYMNDEDAVKWFSGRDDWHDSICGLKSPLTAMDDMLQALVKSAEAGNNLRLTTMPLAGRTAPHTPQGCMILNQAEVMFMLVVAQTAKPGVLCMFGGMPCTTGPHGDLAYSHDAMNLLNVAVARLNMWVTGLPTVQSGGSTEAKKPDAKALQDGDRGRRILCEFGVHNARHCFGVLDNLNFFSEEAFVKDCEAHRSYLKSKPEKQTLTPLHIPTDDQALEVIRRVAGGDYYVDYHTTAHISVFDDWADELEAKCLLPSR